MKKADIKRGRHGKFELFVEDDDGILIQRGQYSSAIEAEADAKNMGASMGDTGRREKHRESEVQQGRKRREISATDAEWAEVKAFLKRMRECVEAEARRKQARADDPRWRTHRTQLSGFAPMD